MAAFKHSIRGRTFVRSTVLLLATGGLGYIAGALVHNTVPSSNDSAAFAGPAPAADWHHEYPLPASSTFTPAVVEWSQPERERIPQPRECDLAQGVSTECVYMD
jgi:hypothetical protein